ncbi:ABC transporter permease [Pseudomonas daroniae]|uniref:ABC transporter permease n=1 Tax=Phytopseudomonas daroniae TaxID=2487519 RepID=A0A4V2KAB4_9GAMM|nr:MULTISPECIES: ABC transporter permease [Pseudomonas]TBU73415.1 ABC transporter permease [Pseudomonas daroniae]TBU79167.1 ABC transporter permease [Pseudomonas sp. FRB 228]TBU88065.1 ABC transporter permease [Pseudomonas daroniae]
MAYLRRFSSLLVLVLIGLSIGLINPNFFDPLNLSRIATTSAIPLLMALGGMFVIQMGSIDLSIEGVVAIAAVCFALLVGNTLNGNDLGLWVLPLVVLIGACAGLVNGLVQVKLRIPSFMATLGIGFVGVGLATALLAGNTVRVTDMEIRAIALQRWLGLPLSVWIALLGLGVAHFISRHTVLGRHALAIGGGEDLARLNGVDINRVRILVFALAGAFYGAASILAVAQFGQGHALIAQGQLFTAITAIVVGGASLAGGNGSPFGTLIGILIVVVVSNGMVLMGIPPYVQQGVQGALIIAAVALAHDRAKTRVVK